MIQGIRRSYTLLVFYVMKTIERLGTEPALDILEEATEEQGILISNEMMKTLPRGLTALETGAEVYRRFMADAGAEVSVHKKDNTSVTFLIRRCPFYEAFLDVGVDCGYFLNGICNNLTLPSIQATLKHFDPWLRIESILTRQTAEEFCLERIILAEI